LVRRIAVAFMTTISGLVLLFSYHTSRNQTSSAATELEPASSSQSVTSSPGGEPSPTAAPSPDETSEPKSTTSATPLTATPRRSTTTKKATPTTRAYTGDAIDTEYGPVQVKITVRSGKIASSDVVQVPLNNPHDEKINNHAVPILNQDAVNKQSAELDSVSGATATVDGYKASLQAAIDQANL
jgi:uncharacterized protein with FMN-binding domain